jgi:protein-S-isoprenylcysteine O-methyltransferase Ste14
MTQATTRITQDDRDHTAGVLAAPPLLFGAALIAALALHAIHGLPITLLPSSLLRVLGVSLIVAGFFLSGAVVRAFGRAGTQVSPYRATTRFVSTGPYRYTRNPDYIGQTLMYAGIALVAKSWWPLVLLPLVLILVQRGVVRREEWYLEAKFGQEYRNYLERVPRWL